MKNNIAESSLLVVIEGGRNVITFLKREFVFHECATCTHGLYIRVHMYNVATKTACGEIEIWQEGGGMSQNSLIQFYFLHNTSYT